MGVCSHLPISVFRELFPIRREPGNERKFTFVVGTGIKIPGTLHRGLSFLRRVLASVAYV